MSKRSKFEKAKIEKPKVERVRTKKSKPENSLRKKNAEGKNLRRLKDGNSFAANRISAPKDESKSKNLELKLHPLFVDYLPYAYYKTAMHLKMKLDEGLRQSAFGLWSIHLGVLRILSQEGPQDQSALVQDLGSDKASMVKIISQLELKGYIHQVRDASDKRWKRISISRKGQSALLVAVKIRQGVQDEFLSFLSSEEQVALKAIVLKLLKAHLF